MRTKNKLRYTVSDLTVTSLFVALFAVCAFISVPLPFVSFTMQTFAVFLAVYILGTLRSLVAVSVYIILGALGVPVFAGFRGGISVLLGPTGGFIAGFVPAAIISGLLIERSGYRRLPATASMLAGLAACYASGSVWFARVYASRHGPVTVRFVLTAAVLPFVVPDVIKIVIAAELGRRLKPYADRITGRQ